MTTTSTNNNYISWRWLTPLLLTVLIAIGSWFTSSVLADVGRIKIEAATHKAATDLRIQSLEAQIEGVRRSQERNNRLLVKIATRMGIEVAE